MTQDHTVRVVKVGGSLLDLPDLPLRINDWLAAQPAAHNVLIVGGGPLVEQVRRWHLGQRSAEKGPFEEVAAHWICIDLMSVTARIFHAWLPGLKFTAEMRMVKRRVQKAGETLFDVAKWMRREEGTLPGTPLPCQWEVTSDSIAARLAIVLSADELVLLKSSRPQTKDPRLTSLAEEAYIDRMLPLLAAELPPLRMVNFRDE
jgi:aspartokinase-like uncharacterized kinase